MKDSNADAVLLTPPGPGAVASIRLQGPSETLSRLSTQFQPVSGPSWDAARPGQVVYGRWGDTAPEDVVMCPISDSVVELHCHGGRAAVQRILADVSLLGFPSRDSRAVNITTGDFLKSECQRVLTDATTLRTASLLLNQAELLPEAIRSLKSSPPAEALVRIEELLRWGDFGWHLTHPWNVVLCGRPNVGKSSLINALLGYSRAIVSDSPGTTRNVVTSFTALEGWPIELADTAGLRTTADQLEESGMAVARRHLANADLQVLVLDIGAAPRGEDRELLQTWPDALVVGHKADLPDRWGHARPAGALAVSSHTGEGLEQLAGRIVGRLVPVVPSPSTPLPVSRRQLELLQETRDTLASERPQGWQHLLDRLLGN